MERSKNGGFTLIELLIVVAIIGIIAAISIPNLLNAIHRGKQKRTMADLRTIATAIESYNVDNSAYPAATSMAGLSGSLVPVFLDTLPASDGWGRGFTINSVATDYTVWSGGSDGGSLNYVGGPTSSLSASIVFVNGEFAQWPEGSQTD